MYWDKVLKVTSICELLPLQRLGTVLINKQFQKYMWGKKNIVKQLFWKKGIDENLVG